MNSVETCIAEAKEQGINTHDYVALKMYGMVNSETRRRAKNLCFFHLYGGEPKARKSENFAIQMNALTPEIKSWPNPCKEIPVRQYHQYVVKIKSDEEKEALYCVPASDARSARVLAFALYGGFGGSVGEGPTPVHLEDDNIETALNWTEVIQ